MNRVFHLEDVEPTGTERTMAYVQPSHGPCRLEPIDVPVYPVYPFGGDLRHYRRCCGMSLGQTAKRLGISPKNLCDLEHGRKRFASKQDEDAVLRLLGGV